MGSNKNYPGARPRGAKSQEVTKDASSIRPPHSRKARRISGDRNRGGDGPALARERLLTEAEVAEWLGISPLTLRKWRCLRTHSLPFLKIAKVIRYKESDVLPFLESHMVVPHNLEGRSWPTVASIREPLSATKRLVAYYPMLAVISGVQPPH
jgi:hypothetical protein